MWYGFTVFVLATSVTCYSDNHSNGIVYVDELTSTYLSIEQEIWNDLTSNTNSKNLVPKIQREHFKLFSNEVFNENDTSAFLKGFAGSTEKNFFVNEMKDVELMIRVLKRDYLQDLSDPDSLREKLIQMAENNSNTTLMNRMYEDTIGEEFFELIKKIGDNQDCTRRAQTIESTNYQIFQYYNTIAKYQLCAYAFVQLSHMLFVAYGEKTYVEKAKSLHNTFRERTRETQERVRELMILANRDIWKCDLSSVTYDESMYQITNLVEGFVENEVNLNSDNNCKTSCSDYTNTKTYGCHEGTLCYEESQNPKVRCNGTVLDCSFIEADMKICFTESYSNRRYTNIYLNSGRRLGRHDCHRATKRASSWTRWLVQCSTCFCYCDEASENSERYFSLKDVVSDITSNQIVTAVGLYKRKGIFTWEIAQSTVLSNGRVNLTKPWNAFVEREMIDHENMGVDGVDYHRLSWQNRSINLDTIIAPAGTLVTGVRFQLVDGVLNLQIRATKFEFSTGRLFNDHEWLSSTNNHVHRTPIDLLNSDLPSRANKFSDQNKEVNKFVQFQPTGIDQDAAQTTIPFIDSQLIEAYDRQSPLSGVGIFFKGVPEFGGFIAPKVITYDMSPHIGKSSH